MRKIINISVPEPMKQFVQHRVAEGNYGSVSEYFRELVRLDHQSERAARQLAARRHIIRGENVASLVANRPDPSR